MIQKIYLFLIFATILSCSKPTDYSLEGSLPSKPEIEVKQVEGDPNRFVVTDLSTGNFNRVWVFANGAPTTSVLKSDTVFYNRQGEYDIVLHVSAEDGNGTAFTSQTVVVQQDAAGCPYKFMTEDCTQKCWRLSGLEGGVKVGPTPFSGEWYTSPDIVPDQADDKWCFSEENVFLYDNNGSSFSSCQGFIEVPGYPIPADLSWNFIEGGGEQGLDRIEINGIWMGVEDTGPTYDIFTISDEEMVVLTPIRPCDGAPSNGWFTLTFFATE